jgi:hypothetical protein
VGALPEVFAAGAVVGGAAAGAPPQAASSSASTNVPANNDIVRFRNVLTPLSIGSIIVDLAIQALMVVMGLLRSYVVGCAR